MKHTRRVNPFVFLLFLAAVAGAQSPSADDTARFLAGLPIEGTSLRNFAAVPVWRQHAKQINEAWGQSERRQLMKVRAWAPAALGEAHTAASPMFYFLSGADFLYPHALFPNAGTYVLCSKEPVGAQPDPARIPPEELEAALAIFRKSLSSLLDFSFFITKDLRSDISQKHIPGVLPVLELILARNGAHIVDVAFVHCDRSGAIVFDAKAKGGSPGVCIRFTRGNGREQRLYYFDADISNGGLKSNEGVLRFCERLGRGQSLLKATSYLTHQNGFTHIRDWVLEHSRTIVQDPSGIPFRAFDPAKWTVRLWGNNADPTPLFAQHLQPDLKAAVEASPGSHLPFGFGYQYLSENALLMIAQTQR
jgi:hypothetical protein